MIEKDKKLINLFNLESQKRLNINDKYASRKATEEEYFIAYLYFISNSSYYSRFKYYNERTKHHITGKTLNNKVNKWNNSKIDDIEEKLKKKLTI